MTRPRSLTTAFSKSSGSLAMLAAVMPSKLTPPVLSLSLWQPEQYCLTTASCASAGAGAWLADGRVKTPTRPMAAITGIEILTCRIVFIESLSVRRKISPQAFQGAANEFIRVAHLVFVFLGRL